MPLDTFAPPVAPSPGTTRRPEVKILSAQFGDGYTQDAPDGLNHVRQVLDVRWDVLTQAQAKLITDFLAAKGGVTPFYYKHPFTPVLKYTCGEWMTNDAGAGLCSVTVKFRQSFTLVS